MSSILRRVFSQVSRNQRGQLDGRVAIITGGASGIGRETCVEFAREGAKVVIADLNKNESQKTLDRIRFAYFSFLFFLSIMFSFSFFFSLILFYSSHLFLLFFSCSFLFFIFFEFFYFISSNFFFIFFP